MTSAGACDKKLYNSKYQHLKSIKKLRAQQKYKKAQKKAQSSRHAKKLKKSSKLKMWEACVSHLETTF